MAPEPKSPRKRASKKASTKSADSSVDAVNVQSPQNNEAGIEEGAAKRGRKKSIPAAVATPIFQAAPAVVAPKDRKANKSEKPAQVDKNESEEDSESRRGGRRRRRGGRGRRK